MFDEYKPEDMAQKTFRLAMQSINEAVSNGRIDYNSLAHRFSVDWLHLV